MNRMIVFASALLFLSANAQAASEIQKATVQWAVKLQTIQNILQKEGNALQQALTQSHHHETPKITVLRARIHFYHIMEQKMEAARPKTPSNTKA